MNKQKSKICHPLRTSLTLGIILGLGVAFTLTKKGGPISIGIILLSLGLYLLIIAYDRCKKKKKEDLKEWKKDLISSLKMLFTAVCFLATANVLMIGLLSEMSNTTFNGFSLYNLKENPFLFEIIGNIELARGLQIDRFSAMLLSAGMILASLIYFEYFHERITSIYRARLCTLLLSISIAVFLLGFGLILLSPLSMDLMWVSTLLILLLSAILFAVSLQDFLTPITEELRELVHRR